MNRKQLIYATLISGFFGFIGWRLELEGLQFCGFTCGFIFGLVLACNLDDKDNQNNNFAV